MPAAIENERRMSPRVRLSCLVLVEPSIPTVNNFEEILATENSCRQGVYFISDLNDYHKDMRLFITFPYSSAAGALNREYVGHVKRVEPLPGGLSGVAVHLLSSVSLKEPDADDDERHSAATRQTEQKLMLAAKGMNGKSLWARVRFGGTR